MDLIEADAKQLLADHGLPTPAGRRIYGVGDVVGPVSNPVAVKAQILAGGRGKTGLVRLTNSADGPATISGVLAAMAERGLGPLVMIEDQIAFAEECYLAWRIDDLASAPVLLFSRHGGVDIEDHPDSIRTYRGDALRPARASDLIAFFLGLGFSGRALAAVSRFAADLLRVMLAEDAILVEINPLAFTERGDVVALDAKITLDDNAAVRHGEWRRLRSHDIQQAEASPLELRAAEEGFTFVELEGDVALFTGGAGLGMALIDMLADAGHSAANFVDAPGGSGDRIFGAVTRMVFERAEASEVKAIILFLTLSATSLKGAVQSILTLIETTPPPKPLIVGLVAAGAAEREMTLAEAQAAFRARGVECVTEIADAVAALNRMSRPLR